MQINYEQIVKMAEREVAGKEEFVYSNLNDFGVKRCVYVKDGEPSCLVGCILIKNDIVPVEFFREQDETSRLNDDELGDIVPPLWHEFGVGFTDKAKEFLKILQSHQDCGDSWGVALENAKGRVGKWSSLDD